MTPKLSILPLAQERLWPQLDGVNFDPASSLKALCSYRDGDLMDLPTDIKKYLIAATKGVRTVPLFTPLLAPAHR